MASLRYSAVEESEDTLNSFTSPTGYEPNHLAFGEFSFMIPSTDQDVDDVTLGEMLTAAHRGQVDYCVPGGMSVSQSSSVMFDGSGQPDGERMVDQSGKSGVTFNVISARSNFSEDIQTEKMVDRSGQPDERYSSNALIRTTSRAKTDDYRGISRKSRSSRTSFSSRRRRAPTLTRTIMETEIGISWCSSAKSYRNGRITEIPEFYLRYDRKTEAHRGPEHYYVMIR